MNIIIDGYNIIKQVFGKKQVTEKERARFLEKLANYAIKKKHALYVVFDGGPYERPTAEKRAGIVSVYSGRRESADDVIKTYIEEQVLKPMLIVTTDRQINAFAARHKVPSIDSLDFYKLMMEEKTMPVTGLQKVSGEAHKLHEEEMSAELDTLMQEAAQVLYYKEEDAAAQKRGAKRKAPKEERHMLKILKKL